MLKVKRKYYADLIIRTVLDSKDKEDINTIFVRNNEAHKIELVYKEPLPLYDEKNRRILTIYIEENFFKMNLKNKEGFIELIQDCIKILKKKKEFDLSIKWFVDSNNEILEAIGI